MRCPECGNEMEQLCMYGTDEEINIDWHCESCGTLATVKWTPSKNKKSHWIPTKNRLPVRSDADNYGRVLTWRLGLAMIIKHDEVTLENASHWMPLPTAPLVDKCNCGKTVDLKKLSSNFEYMGCNEETNPVFRCKDCHIDVCG